MLFRVADRCFRLFEPLLQVGSVGREICIVAGGQALQAIQEYSALLREQSGEGDIVLAAPILGLEACLQAVEVSLQRLQTDEAHCVV